MGCSGDAARRGAPVVWVKVTVAGARARARATLTGRLGEVDGGADAGAPNVRAGPAVVRRGRLMDDDGTTDDPHPGKREVPR